MSFNSNFKKVIITSLALIMGLGLFGCVKQPAVVLNNNVNQAEEVDTSDWETYRNEELGVMFNYELIDKYKKEDNKLYVVNDMIKICISDDTLCNRIRVFNIVDKSPINYISDDLMQDANKKCRIEQKIIGNSYKLKYPNNYQVFSITSLEQGETLGDLVYCGGFGNFTILGYFLFNTNVPNKLLLVKFNNDDNFFANPKEFLESITIF